MIGPLLIIDQAQQRPFSGHIGQQAQHGQSDQEPIRRRPGAHAERGPQGHLLRPRQAIQAIQQRSAQLVQCGERELHLHLHSARARHAAALWPLGEVIQQRRLPDTRLTAHYQRTAFPRPHRRDQPVKHPALGLTASQLDDPLAPCTYRHLHITETTGPASKRTCRNTRPLADMTTDRPGRL